MRNLGNLSPQRHAQGRHPGRATYHELQGSDVIAFNVSGTLVAIIGIFYGDQDYETELNPPDVDATADSGTTQ